MDKAFQCPKQEIKYRINFHTFQFPDPGTSTQLGCAEASSHFCNKMIISPIHTLCQFRPNSVKCLSMCLNPVLFKEASKHTLNYDILKSMGLRYALCQA